ncbi:hypothetical protein CLCR_11413 [Cladophialophora carrionii]|uniref:Uncharacterized protein n=1 Tax=Cladophialophora carrionii TaxID=86049 RepID=A0A1C1CYL5_9EURO|nr:hypothetical protein CLCR_11413 [Cladophialophora carrionii]
MTTPTRDAPSHNECREHHSRVHPEAEAFLKPIPLMAARTIPATADPVPAEGQESDLNHHKETGVIPILRPSPPGLHVKSQTIFKVSEVYIVMVSRPATRSQMQTTQHGSGMMEDKSSMMRDSSIALDPVPYQSPPTMTKTRRTRLDSNSNNSSSSTSHIHLMSDATESPNTALLPIAPNSRHFMSVPVAQGIPGSSHLLEIDFFLLCERIVLMVVFLLWGGWRTLLSGSRLGLDLGFPAELLVWITRPRGHTVLGRGIGDELLTCRFGIRVDN